MPGGYAASVIRGRALEGVSRWLTSLSKGAVQALRADLDPAQTELPLVDAAPYDPARPGCIVEKHGLPAAYSPPHPHLAWSDDKPHLHRDWFPAPGEASRGWWQAEQPIEPLLRAGLCTALDRLTSLDPRPPVDCCWVPCGSHVEVNVVEAKDRRRQPPVAAVLLLVIVTPPPVAPPEPLGNAELEPIWVCKRVRIGPGERVVDMDPEQRWVTTRPLRPSTPQGR